MSAIIRKDCDIMWQRSSKNVMDTCLFVALRHKAGKVQNFTRHLALDGTILASF